jgi:hypothetical protein
MLEILLGIILSILTSLGLSDDATTCVSLPDGSAATAAPCPPPAPTDTDADDGSGLIKVGGSGLIKVGGSG